MIFWENWIKEKKIEAQNRRIDDAIKAGMEWFFEVNLEDVAESQIEDGYKFDARDELDYQSGD